MRTTPTRTLLLAATASMAIAGPAGARPAPEETPSYPTGTVNVTAGKTLKERATPTRRGSVMRALADGARVSIVCQTRGDRMRGTYGTSRLWNRLSTGGYVTDTKVYTGSDGRVAPRCDKPAGGSRPASITMRDDYPYADGSWHDVDPWAFYKRECTSFVAYRLNKVMKFHNLMRGGRFSNAENWDENARSIGFRVNSSPRRGSVMVRNSGTYGHVAMVARVGKGRVLVEQYNAGGTHNYSREWLTVQPYMTFIHFPR